MKIKQLLPIALAGLLGTVGSASAAPITFSFDSNTWYPSEVTTPSMTQMGTTVTMAGTDTLYNTLQGVGVGDDALTSTGESISFTFTPNAVSLLSGVVFESSMTLSGADFNLYGDGTLLNSFSFLNTWSVGGSYFTSLDFGSWNATEFMFSGMSNNGFRIKKLTVDVPEPGMVALMGMGLLLAGVATRRRRKS